MLTEHSTFGKAATVSPTSSYALPLVPAAVLLGLCTFLIFVPVLALAAVVTVIIAILSAVATAIAALLTSIYRWSNPHLVSARGRIKQRRLARQAGVLADATRERPGEAQSVHLPIHSKGI